MTPALRDWSLLKQPPLRAVFDALDGEGRATRIVGGAVRDALLGRDVTDADLATVLLPADVIARAEAAGLKTVPTGIEHGTVTVVSGGRPFEVTTLRRDIETDGRHAVVRYSTDWKEDASRRDFTMNALYCDMSGEVFDPLGGLADLRASRVRFIGRAEDRIREDYLRILRFFRFFAWYGEGRPDPDGLRACARLKSGLCDPLRRARLGRTEAAPQGLRPGQSAPVDAHHGGSAEGIAGKLGHRCHSPRHSGRTHRGLDARPTIPAGGDPATASRSDRCARGTAPPVAR